MLFDVVMKLGLEEITNELIFHNGIGALKGVHMDVWTGGLSVQACSGSYRLDKIRTDYTDLTEIEFATDSLAKQTCVFRFLDNDYKASSSKP